MTNNTNNTNNNTNTNTWGTADSTDIMTNSSLIVDPVMLLNVKQHHPSRVEGRVKQRCALHDNAGNQSRFQTDSKPIINNQSLVIQ